MFILGVTGGIACGKSSVSRDIVKYGAKIISADQLAHDLSEPGEDIYNAYVRHYGNMILFDNGKLDRRAVADIIFEDKAERRWADNTIHPIILNHVRDRLEQYQKLGVPLTVLDVPLLFEAGWDVLVDEVWVVWLNPNRQITRLMYRNRLTENEAVARVKAQMNIFTKRRRADEVINNNGTRVAVYKRVQFLMQKKFPHLSRCQSIEEEEMLRRAARKGSGERQKQSEKPEQTESPESAYDAI